MKVFVVICAAILFVGVYAHPHHHGGHQHSSESSESSDSSGDCEKPKPPPPPPPPPTIRPELQAFIDDLKDFYALYPIDEIKEILQAHLEDPELQATIAWLRSDEFEDIVEALRQDPDIRALGEYYANADWPWAERMIRSMMKQRQALRFFAGRQNDNSTATGGLDGLIDDIIAVLPAEDLRALFDDKMANSTVFAAVIQIVTSDEVRQLVQAVRDSENLQPLFQQIEDNGVHGEKIKEYILALFGW